MSWSEDDVDHRTTGKLGIVTVPVRPGKPGEVVVPVRGGTEAYAAYSDEPIDRNVQVVIVDTSGPRAVIVARF